MHRHRWSLSLAALILGAALLGVPSGVAVAQSIGMGMGLGGVKPEAPGTASIYPALTADDGATALTADNGATTLTAN